MYENVADSLDRRIQGIVNDGVLVFASPSDLAAGHFEPPLDGLFVLGGAGSQPPFEFRLGAGMEEDRQDPGDQVPDLGRAVHIYIQDNPFWAVAARWAARRDLRAEGAVPVATAENLEAFEEFAGLAAALEIGRIEEVVVDTFLFAGPGCSGRRRYAQPQPVRKPLEQPPQQRTLADSRGAGENDEMGGVRQGRGN